MNEIDVKQAVKIATQYLKKLYGGQSISNIRLEEVEFDDEERNWLITISFIDIDDLIPERVYKILEIDADTAEVIAMKMREYDQV
ncbi:MAG TPA: PepSY domain-containing protein [Pyrinomonadaceae bacterium]|jgi:hypothetical protein|nr:PepSY domain-containing protein [Pyrinomonadaceae bacterium]